MIQKRSYWSLIWLIKANDFGIMKDTVLYKRAVIERGMFKLSFDTKVICLKVWHGLLDWCGPKLDQKERIRSNERATIIILIINCLQLHGLRWASKATVPFHSHKRNKKTQQNKGRGVMLSNMSLHVSNLLSFCLVSIYVKWATERQNYKER